MERVLAQAHYYCQTQDLRRAMSLELFAQASFKAQRRPDLPAHQRFIAHALRNRYQSIAAQDVPEQMLELLRLAEARGRLTVGSSSLTTAMTIVAALVALFVLYDVAWLAVTRPALGAVIAIIAALGTIGAAVVWLIEDDQTAPL